MDTTTASSSFEFPRRIEATSRAATFQIADDRRRTRSPLRHHRRAFSSGPHEVIETLNARTQYVEDEDGIPGIKKLNQYTLGERMGKGVFGSVVRATDQNGNSFAIKEFSKSHLRRILQNKILKRPRGPPFPRSKGLHQRTVSDISKDLERGNPLNLIKEEIAIMKKLDHPNIVHLYEVLDDPEDDSLYMVMEMCSKGEVMKLRPGDRTTPFSEEQARLYFRDLILGMEYLHAQGICHRDIKPENLVLSEHDELKIADFGVSEMFQTGNDTLKSKHIGSPAFAAPELCRQGTVEPISGKATDIWAMGVMLYCFIFGELPFFDINPVELYRLIWETDFEFKWEVDPRLKDLLLRILEKDPKKRIKMPELREHPWVTHDGEDMLLSTEENTVAILVPTQAEIKSALTFGVHTFAAVAKAVKSFKSLSRRSSFAQPGLERQSTLQVPDESDFHPVSSPIRGRSIDLSHDLDRVSIDGDSDERIPRRMDSAIAMDNDDDDSGRPATASPNAPAIEIQLVDSPVQQTFEEPLTYSP